MHFIFEGVNYRIRFKHDRVREWTAHAKHEVSLVRKTVNQLQSGPAFLVCLTCSGQLGEPFRLSHLSKREQERRVTCEILRQSGSEWLPVFRGDSRLNRDSSDRYSREGGRRAALHNALNPGDVRYFEVTGAGCDAERRRFRLAAGTAYNTRTTVIKLPKPAGNDAPDPRIGQDMAAPEARDPQHTGGAAW